MSKASFIDELRNPEIWQFDADSPVHQQIGDIERKASGLLVTGFENDRDEELYRPHILAFVAMDELRREIFPAQTLAERSNQSLKANAKGLRVLGGNTETAIKGLNYGENRRIGLYMLPNRPIKDLRHSHTALGGIINHAALMARDKLFGTEAAVMHSDKRYEGREIGLIDVAPSKRTGTEPGDFWIAYRGQAPMRLIASKVLPQVA